MRLILPVKQCFDRNAKRTRYFPKGGYRHDGLPMGEVDPNATGPNGLLWGQRDLMDILSLDQATGWFEWDVARWQQWKVVARAGLAEALLERAHILFRQRRTRGMSMPEKQRHVATLLARLVHGFVAEGRQTQFADPTYDQTLIRQTSMITPLRLQGMAMDKAKFPFRSGTGIKTTYNPLRETPANPFA